MTNAADAIVPPDLDAATAARPAILFHDQSVSYGELNRRINRCGQAFRRCGLASGDRVLLLLDDSPLFVAAYLGAMRAGGVSVAINTRVAAKDLHYILRDSVARLLVVDAGYLPVLRDALAIGLEYQLHVLLNMDIPASSDETIHKIADTCRMVQVSRLPELLTASYEHMNSAQVAADAIALWIYTSGTTGAPKAAMHRHGSVCLGDVQVRDNLGVQPGERLYASSKLFFAYALGHCLIAGLRARATLVLDDLWPDGARVHALVARHRPHILFSVPTLYRNLLRDGHAACPEFHDIRHFMSAGERLPPALCQQWQEATGQPILEGLGASETLFLMLANTPKAHRLGTTGRALPGVELRLTDTAGVPLLESTGEGVQEGVLWARTGAIAAGYWQQPDKTAATFQEGWYRTGDMFRHDGDGWWTHQGRADDLLKISGQWVSPAEIEDTVATVPGVREAVVIGLNNADGLERLALCLVGPVQPQAQQEVLAAVQERLRARLAIYKCPRTIRFVDQIPRTATGKVQRFRLRALFEDAMRPVPLPQQDRD